MFNPPSLSSFEGIDKESFTPPTASSKEDDNLSASELTQGLAARVFNSATLNFGDEIAGTAAKIVGTPFAMWKGQDLKTFYQNIDNLTKGEEQLRKKTSQQAPLLSLAADITGVSMLPLGTVKGAITIPKVVKTGALVGGIYGAGEEGDLIDRAKTGLGGSAVGAGLGALGTAAIKATPSVAKGAITGTGNVIKGVSNIFRDVPAEEVIKNALGNEGMKVAQKITEQGNRLVDVPELQGLARRIVKVGGDEGSLIRQEVESSYLNAPDRFQNILDETFVTPYFSKLNKVVEDKKMTSKLLYDAFVNNNNKLIYSNELEDFSKLPVFKDYFNRAAGLYEKFGQEAPMQLTLAKNEPFVTTEKGLSLKIGDKMKKLVDADIEKYGNKMSSSYSPEEAMMLNDFRSNLLNILDKEVSEYPITRDLAKGYKRIEAAQEEGQGILRKSKDEIKDILNKYNSSDEKNAIKIALGKGLMEKLGKSKTPANALLNFKDKQKLQMILGNDYQSFLNNLNKESSTYRTYNNVLHGSRTDINLAQGNQLIDKAVDFVKNPKTGLLQMIIDPVGAKMSGLTEKNIKEVTKLLLSEEGAKNTISTIAKKTNTNESFVRKIAGKIKTSNTQKD